MTRSVSGWGLFAATARWIRFFATAENLRAAARPVNVQIEVPTVPEGGHACPMEDTVVGREGGAASYDVDGLRHMHISGKGSVPLAGCGL